MRLGRPQRWYRARCQRRASVPDSRIEAKYLGRGHTQSTLVIGIRQQTR